MSLPANLMKNYFSNENATKRKHSPENIGFTESSNAVLAAFNTTAETQL